jgi:integrase
MIRTLKRGTTFYVDYSTGDRRLRGSLGTKDKNVASRLKSRIEISMAEGSKSAGWVDLRKVLPVETYHRLAGHAGLSRQAVPSWSGLVSIFWKDCERRRLAKGTVVRYQSTVDRFEEYLEFVGLDLLEDLTAHLIRDFREWRQAQILKNPRSRNGGGLYQDMSALHFIFACGVENGLIAKNPVAKESRPDVVRGTKPYSGAELAAIREACEPADLLTFLLFRWTGMRGSDVADLRCSDVHFLDGEIRRKAIKNGVWLQIPLHPELMDALVAAHEWKKPEDNVLKVKNKVVDRAFLARQMRLIYCRANITDGHNHRFRASLAVDMLLKGAAVYEVAKLLGDTVATVEKHYLRFVPQMRDRVRGFMDDSTKGLEAK